MKRLLRLTGAYSQEYEDLQEVVDIISHCLEFHGDDHDELMWANQQTFCAFYVTGTGLFVRETEKHQ